MPSDPIFMGVFLVIIGVIQFHVFMGKYSLIGGITYIGGNSPDRGYPAGRNFLYVPAYVHPP